MRVNNISFSFLNRMDLEGLLVRDHSKDTLLYAGTMKVRITDWFIFKDKAELKYVGLEDAVIKLNRRDSVWNYQFLVDYFASSNSPSPTPAKKKKTIEFDLKKLDLRNISLVQQDDWRGETLTLKLSTLLMEGRKMDFEKAEFDVAELTVDKPYFAIHNYPGRRPKRPKKQGAFHLNPGGLLLRIAKLELNNGTFVNDLKTERPAYRHFDGAHMVISEINGDIDNFSFIGDTIRGNVKLSAQERSGFELEKLQARFTFNPQIMEFRDLDLQTPRSRIRDYYSMRYDHFDDDMSAFVSSVMMEAHFIQSEIHTDDIAYFAPGIASWNREINASGRFRGTVEDLRGNNVYLRAGNSAISGDVSVKGITDINTALFTLSDGTVTTSYNDLAVYVPGVKKVNTPDLKSLGPIRFNGSFNGTVSRFGAKGNLSTSLGNAYTNISMNLPKRGQPTYTGSVSTRGFELGKFLKIPRLGTVSMDGRISGTGFEVNTLRTNFDGTISRLEYGSYTYQNIRTNGVFQKGAFSGEVRMNDPSLNFTSNISIDFNGAEPHFVVLGDVANANLQALKLTKDRFVLAGLFDLDFTGSNIDNFVGYAKLINASLMHDSTRLSFDSVSIQTDYQANEKVLTVRSNEIDATVKGQYNILDLPQSFQSYLHNYFPSYISAPARVPQGQKFTVDVTTRNIADFIRIVDNRLAGFDNAMVSGSINTTRPDSGFVITTTVPYFRFQNVGFSGVQFSGTGNASSLKLSGNLDLVTVGDSLYFPNTKLTIESADDISSVSIRTKANNTLNEADLNATVQTMEDGVQINFRPSSFVINDEKWTLEKEGELVLRKHYIAARDIRFSQGFQEITVSTRTPDGGNVDELVVNLKDIHLGDFIPFVTREPRMEGLVSGEVVITDIFDQLSADARLNASEFRLDDDSLGNVQIIADYARRTGKVNYRVISPNEPYNLAIEGLYDTKDTTGAPLATTLKLNGTRISFINRFLSGIFSDIDGYATGELKVIGKINRPHLLGKVKLRNAGMKVNYTQVYYTIAEADLDFRDDRIDFGRFTLQDNLGNTGNARGILYQHAFQNMQFDFDLATQKMLLLDTKPTDNENFYGRAIGRATLNIRGGEDDIRMTIAGEVNDTSHIFIPTSDARETGEADFIVFKQPGREVRLTRAASTNVTVDLDVSATNKAQIDVILDPVAGDVLKARGTGRLRIHAGTTDAVSMNGRYNIEQGSYDFNFQSVLSKGFTIDPNANNYIEWTGDPYQAEIHVDAMYTASNVSLSDLISDKVDLGATARTYRGDVYVVAELRNKLSEPAVKFRIDFPTTAGLASQPGFTEFMANLASNTNERNKQVTYLLVFNTFAPYGEGRNLAQNIQSLVYNSISQFVNRQINKLVSDWLFERTGFKFDINASIYSSASLIGGGGTTSQNALASLDRMGLGVKFWRGFLNNRIIINVGTNVDFTRVGAAAAFQTGNLQFLPDFNVEFVLDKQGRLRLILFQRNTLDISTGNSSLGRRNRSGISISYSKEFD
ncbi:MAG TPA: translocation/assembly module TamB domain-containing protein [Chitinophagaceae bacterium]